MSFITLIQNRSLNLATDQLVYDASEVGSLESIVEKSRELNSRLESVEGALDKARQIAVVEGYKIGLETGRAEARKTLAEALLHAQKVHLGETQELRKASVQLALDIVRKIGLNKSSEDNGSSVLLDLAINSAKELKPEEAACLHVNPVHKDKVGELFSNLPELNKLGIVQIVEDESLEEDACVLNTRYGSIHAGLEAQLSVIEETLNAQ